MSSIKYIIGQYSRVNSFIRSRGCAALDRINEFTREYCPITYTKNKIRKTFSHVVFRFSYYQTNKTNQNTKNNVKQLYSVLFLTDRFEF